METKHTVKLRMFQCNTNTIRKGVKAMNKKGGIWAWMRLILLLMPLLACLILTQTPVHGAVNCATAGNADYDGDGFTDAQECFGILYAGSQPPEPSIQGKNSGLPRPQRLDPDTEDLFVILVRAVSGTKIPPDADNPLEFVSNTLALGGLGITVHLITEAHVENSITRRVSLSSGQRAVYVVESLDPGSTAEQINTLGACDQGMVLDGCIVWTQRIENKIAAICGANWSNESTCKDKTGVWGLPLRHKYIKHTIAHEVGHAINLKVVFPYHSNPSTSNPKEMDSSVAVKGKVFSIGTVFTTADQAGFIQQ
jgi:hypothetical protein